MGGYIKNSIAVIRLKAIMSANVVYVYIFPLHPYR